MNRMIRWTALIAVVVWAASCFYRSYDEPARIVFARDVSGTFTNYEIFLSHYDGSGEKMLTDNTFNDKVPSFSPDGNSIVYRANTRIAFMNADGGKKYETVIDGDSPSWSPDGKKIVFKYTATGNLAVMSTDGSGLVDIGVVGFNPSWSPDGKKILYTNGGGNLYTVNPDGSGNIQITFSNQDYAPSWSPDGTRIVVTRGPSPYCVYLITDAGADLMPLTVGDGWSPSWSPDGKEIIYKRGTAATQEIYIVKTDGTGERQITFNAVADEDPCFQGKPK